MAFMNPLRRRGWLISAALLALSCSAAEEKTFAELGLKPTPNGMFTAKITVADLHKSLDFYTHVVGFKEVTIPGVKMPGIDDPNAKLIEVMLNFSGSPEDDFLTLIKQKGVVPAQESAKLTWLGIKMDDVRTAVKRAKAMGLTVDLEPVDHRGITVSLIRDPDGYVVELQSNAKPAAR